MFYRDARRLPGGPWPLLAAASLLGWVGIGIGIGIGTGTGNSAGGMAWSMPAVCGAMAEAWGRVDGVGVRQFWLANPPLPMLAAWLMMLCAMMPLLLIQPAAHLWRRSLARRRWRALAWFCLGYFGVWLCAAALLPPLAVGLRIFGTHATPPMAVALACLGFWQSTPFRQHCLNRCHYVPHLCAFGWRSDRDGMRYGVDHGAACLGACWPWMLLTLTTDAHHLASMAVAGMVLALERQGLPQPPAWRLPFVDGIAILARRLRSRYAFASMAAPGGRGDIA